MTAYRTSPAPADTPYVNPYLERALLEYYRNFERRYVASFVLCAAATLACLVGVLVFRRPDEWLLHAVIVIVPGYCAWRTGLAWRRRRSQILLERIRSGVPIRRVLRSTEMFRVLATSGRANATNEIPTIFVEFVDGRAMMLPSLGDLGHLARIEQLLREQMEAPR